MKENIKPVVKWTGGKYDEFKEFKHLIPNFQKYYEPFVGGGGVFFALRPQGKTFLNDSSSDLILFYQQLTNPLFHKELWKYVKAWEQSPVLAKQMGTKLISVVEQYLTGNVSEATLCDEIDRAISTIPYKIYTPLFTPSFIISRNQYMHYLRQSLRDTCGKLKKMVSKEKHARTERVSEQIETAVQTAFYTHIRWLYNHYETKKHFN